MSLGKILAKTAMRENLHTTWYPSYGAEVRGGSAYCFVKISGNPIGSPLAAKPDIAVIFNKPSLGKFMKSFPAQKKCMVIINADLVEKKDAVKIKHKLIIPFNKIALECGAARAVNVVALGVLVSLYPGIFKKETVLKVLAESLPQGNSAENLKAFERGLAAAKPAMDNSAKNKTQNLPPRH
jgi:2-oxoglutarate ferredoxin oxidoreductase subunit gamma